MRQRKRADWPIRTSTYSLRPVYETWENLPSAAQQEITQARMLWNALVDAFDRRQARYREIVTPSDRSPDIHSEKTTRAALSQLQQSFVEEARHVSTQYPVTWAYREFILTQFLATVTRFLRRQGKAPIRKQGVPTEVHFHHRFAGGGFPIAGIFGRSQRLTLEPVAAAAFDPVLSQRQRKRLARTSGVFQVGATALPFQLLLHRPLPQDAVLKNAAFIGRQVLRMGFRNTVDGGRLTAARWVWSLHLTMEVPPEVRPAPESQRSTMVLDLSQQTGGEGQLRLGVVADVNGQEEPLFLPKEILRAWWYKRQLQQQADHCLGETKGLLKEIENRYELPAAVSDLLKHMSRRREKSLWHVWQVLERAQANEEILAILRRWADRSTRMTREVRGLERRYLARRDWFYHNVAAQFCRQYQQIIVKLPPPLLLPDDREDNQVLPQANTYRHLAAPTTFLSYLRQAAEKTGTEVKTTTA